MKERWWLLIYIAAVAIVVAFVFRRFLLSDQTLFSQDLLSAGNAFRQFLKTQLFERGSFPGWNPYKDCGLPFVDSIHGGALYPLTFFELCGNIFRTVGYSFMLHFVMASLFAYLAAREIGLSRVGATMSGVAYGLSPCLISWVAPGHDGKIYTAAWFPLVFLFLERSLIRRRFRDCAMLGLTYGLVILTPHLQLAYYAALFIAAYSVYRLVAEFRVLKQPRAAFRGGLLVTAGVVIALLVSAVQLLPSAGYLLRDSARAQELKGVSYASEYSLHQEEVISLLVPEFCGANFKDELNEYWGRNRTKDNSESLAPLAFLLALLGCVTAGVRYRTFWCVTSLLVLVYALGSTTPLYQYIIAIVPFFRSMEAPSGAMFIFVFCAAMLAGSAVDRFIRRDETLPTTWTKTQYAVALGVPFLVTAVAIWCTIDAENFLSTYCRWFYPEILADNPYALSKWVDAVTHLPFLTQGLWLAVEQLWIGVAVLWLASQFRAWHQAIWILPAIVAVGAALFTQHFVVPVDPAEVYGRDRGLAEIARQDPSARSVELGLREGTLHMDYHGLANMAGYFNREPIWYSELVGGSLRRNLNNPRLLNLAGVRYPAVANNIRAINFCDSQPMLDTLVRLPYANVIVNPCAFPRAFLVDRYLVVKDRSALIDSVLRGAIDLRRCVLLEEDPRITLNGEITDTDSASIVRYEPNTVEIHVACGSPRMLVLTDNYFAAWRAYVDGVEEKIYRAYGTFRAVELPAGTRRVVFVYKSTLLRVGVWLSLLGLIVVATALMFPRRRDQI